MSSLVRLADYRRQRRPVYFDRRELNQLLSLYSRRVARGQWRDYAIDHRSGLAVFSIYRSSAERPLFSIVKRIPPGEKAPDYALFDGRSRIGRSAHLDELIGLFDEDLRVVR